MDPTAGQHGAAVVTLRDASDVVAMVPYLVGYLPAESLVVVGLTGPRQQVGPVLRADLPPVDRLADAVVQICAVLSQHAIPGAFVLGFSVDAARVDAAIRALVGALSDAGVRVVDAVRADGVRWWRMVGTDGPATGAGPADGVPYDPGCMRVSAEAVAAGLTYGADRDESRRLFATERDTRTDVTALLERLRADPASQTARPADPRAAAVELVQRGTAGDPPLRTDDLARLGLAVADVACRDILWAMMDRATARAHLALWSRVARAMPDDLFAGPACLAGFAAWLAGDGTVARHAVDRVLELAPTYSMARLLEEALDRFVDPRSWDSVIAGCGLDS
jgi:Domain of unknown function (DUF4192)